ncbi:MAG: hypothetical protein ACTS6P_01360 [Candidatus Hodgkinia cicadicola]
MGLTYHFITLSPPQKKKKKKTKNKNKNNKNQTKTKNKPNQTNKTPNPTQPKQNKTNKTTNSSAVKRKTPSLATYISYIMHHCVNLPAVPPTSKSANNRSTLYQQAAFMTLLALTGRKLQLAPPSEGNSSLRLPVRFTLGLHVIQCKWAR